jgi:hypothetical protein
MHGRVGLGCKASTDYLARVVMLILSLWVTLIALVVAVVVGALIGAPLLLWRLTS